MIQHLKVLKPVGQHQFVAFGGGWSQEHRMGKCFHYDVRHKIIQGKEMLQVQIMFLTGDLIWINISPSDMIYDDWCGRLKFFDIYPIKRG